MLFLHLPKIDDIFTDCFTYDVDSADYDIESKSDISSMHECQKLCYGKEDCKYFLFGETSHEGTCWLKTDKVATFTTLSGLVFGPKTCGKKRGFHTNHLVPFQV